MQGSLLCGYCQEDGEITQRFQRLPNSIFSMKDRIHLSETEEGQIQQILGRAANLDALEPGIWSSKDQSQISYPAEGNERSLLLEESSFWFSHRNECIVSVVNNLPPSGPLFDVGGGNGFVARGLQNAGIPVVLVEPGKMGVKNARQRGIKYILCSTLEQAHFLPDSLPAVGLFDVLEHISDDSAFLRTVRNLLTPGGRLYLTVPAYQWLWSGEDETAGHYRRYSLSSLRRAIDQAGFKELYSTYIFSILPIPIFFARTLVSLCGGRRKVVMSTHYREHTPIPILRHTMELLLEKELDLVTSLKRIPMGGSCLMVAHAH